MKVECLYCAYSAPRNLVAQHVITLHEERLRAARLYALELARGAPLEVARARANTYLRGLLEGGSGHYARAR